MKYYAALFMQGYIVTRYLMNNNSHKVYFPRIRSLWFGMTLPYLAARLILTNRSLLIWSLLPVVLTFVLYIYGISALQGFAIGFLQGYIVKCGFSSGSLIGWFLIFFVKVFLWVVAALTFTFSSSIIASPFNDILAERSEKFVSPPLPPVADKSLKQQIRLIGIDLFKTAAAASAAIFAVLFSWIPILNLVAFVMSFLLVTFQYISYPQTRRGVALKGGSRFLWDHIFACAGFGASLTILFAVPFFSSFILPIAVVGGTLLVARAPGASKIAALK